MSGPFLPETQPLWKSFPAVGVGVSTDEIGYGEGGYGEGGYDTPAVNIPGPSIPVWTVETIQ